MIGLFEKIAELLMNVPPFAMVFPDEGAVFLRLGKYKKTIGCGFYWKWPIFDKVIKIPTKPQEINLTNQSVMRQNGQNLGFSGVVRYQIVNAKKAILDVQDYDASLCNLALRVIANHVSKADDELCTLSVINKEVIEDLKLESVEWGIEIIDFGLSDMVSVIALRIMTDNAQGMLDT